MRPSVNNPDLRATECAGKVAFMGRGFAENAARRRRARSVYLCRFCQLWHVAGRKPPAPRRPRLRFQDLTE
ncbi:MAG: hypothetical protein ACREDY_06470 [Bradyrhizobium sp.]